jgi:hypothetical protein
MTKVQKDEEKHQKDRTMFVEKEKINQDPGSWETK